MEEFHTYSIYEIATQFIQDSPVTNDMPVHPEIQGSRINGLAQVQASDTEGTVVFDICFMVLLPGSGEPMQMIINLEAQKDFYPGYPLVKRAIYYCGRMISGQYETIFSSSHYEKMSKVASIWICLNPPKKRANSIQRYSLTETSIYGESHEPPENYDLISVVMICLGREETCGTELPTVLQLLNALFSEQIPFREKVRLLKEEFGVPMGTELEKEVEEMCNFSYGYYERGLEDGIETGRKEGLETGRDSAFLQNMRTLMERLSYSVEQALDFFRIEGEEREHFRLLLDSMEDVTENRAGNGQRFC